MLQDLSHLVRDLRSFEVINQAMSSKFKGSDAFKLCRKQQVTCDALKKWNIEVFGFSNVKIARLTEKIRNIQMKETRNWRSKAQYKDELNDLKVSLSNHSFCSYSFKVCACTCDVNVSFWSHSFSWVKRELNFVAHYLAKCTCDIDSVLCYRNSFLPAEVCDAWRKDCLFLLFDRSWF